MKIKILEYKLYKCSKVKVRSHKREGGKWKENPQFDLHKKIADGDNNHLPIEYKKEYKKEVE